MSKFIVYTDGGARGNPGPAGVGIVIEYNGKKQEIKKFIGIATNNQAEYWAIIFALEAVINQIESQQLAAIDVDCFLDSQLIEQQLLGNYRVRHADLKPLHQNVAALVARIESKGGKVRFTYVPRRNNKDADKLVNEALDEIQKGNHEK